MSRFATKISDGQHVPTNQMIGLRLPDRNALVGEYILGVSEAESIKNRADPSNPLTVQGAGHVYNPATVTLKSSLTVGYGFISNIIPDEHATLITVRKKASLGTNTMSAGYLNGAGAWGFRMFGASAEYFPGWDSSALNAGGSRPTIPAAGTLFFGAGVSNILNPQLGTGGKSKYYWYEGGVQQLGEAATQSALQSMRRAQVTATARFAIGSNVLSDSGTSTTFEIAFAALYQKPLTAAEVEIAYRAIVAYYASRGVTVT